MGDALLEAHQLQVRVYEAIKVQPQGVDCVGLE